MQLYLKPNPNPPKIAIWMDNGMLRGIISNTPLQVEIIDVDDMDIDEANKQWEALKTELTIAIM
jgi:hypothetical protein